MKPERFKLPCTCLDPLCRLEHETIDFRRPELRECELCGSLSEKLYEVEDDDVLGVFHGTLEVCGQCVEG